MEPSTPTQSGRPVTSETPRPALHSHYNDNNVFPRTREDLLALCNTGSAETFLNNLEDLLSKWANLSSGEEALREEVIYSQREAQEATADLQERNTALTQENARLRMDTQTANDRLQAQAPTATPLAAFAIPAYTKLKIPDPEPFKGDRKTWDQFKLSLGLKISGNSDWFPDEQSKLAYAVSLLRDAAFKQAATHIDYATGQVRLKSYTELITFMETVYGDPDRKGRAQYELIHLKQKNRPFADYYADFMLAANHSGFDRTALKAMLLMNLSDEMQEDLIQNDLAEKTFEETHTLLQRLDNNRRNANDRKSGYHRQTRGPRTATTISTSFSSTPPASTLSAPIPSLCHTQPSDAMDLDAASLRPYLVNGKLSGEEKQRRRDNNLCFYCGGAGHKSTECPRSSQSRTLNGRALDFAPVMTPGIPTGLGNGDVSR